MPAPKRPTAENDDIRHAARTAQHPNHRQPENPSENRIPISGLRGFQAAFAGSLKYGEQA